jgi:hypothetical protein
MDHRSILRGVPGYQAPRVRAIGKRNGFARRVGGVLGGERC